MDNRIGVFKGVSFIFIAISRLFNGLYESLYRIHLFKESKLNLNKRHKLSTFKLYLFTRSKF